MGYTNGILSNSTTNLNLTNLEKILVYLKNSGCLILDFDCQSVDNTSFSNYAYSQLYVYKDEISVNAEKTQLTYNRFVYSSKDVNETADEYIIKIDGILRRY